MQVLVLSFARYYVNNYVPGTYSSCHDDFECTLFLFLEKRFAVDGGTKNQIRQLRYSILCIKISIFEGQAWGLDTNLLAHRSAMNAWPSNYSATSSRTAYSYVPPFCQHRPMLLLLYPRDTAPNTRDQPNQRPPITRYTINRISEPIRLILSYNEHRVVLVRFLVSFSS